MPETSVLVLSSELLRQTPHLGCVLTFSQSVLGPEYGWIDFGVKDAPMSLVPRREPETGLEGPYARHRGQLGVFEAKASQIGNPN